MLEFIFNSRCLRKIKIFWPNFQTGYLKKIKKLFPDTFLMCVFKELSFRPILSSSRYVSLYIYISIYLSPFHVIFSSLSLALRSHYHIPASNWLPPPPQKNEINPATSPKLYRSYYLHRSRDSFSPICGICNCRHPLGKGRDKNSSCFYYSDQEGEGREGEGGLAN